ncbi:MAG: alpha-2,8-polysialyltransferase family protein [Lachnoclostridium sp.]|nr:alpha-2,8-polysialyltransferase family protein [Lachnospira sp.]MCM1249047.1 alpha-2,8-polysialyltransferase family protein [Lachnoclostridium sp.]MCM1535873.1 alpha-2,8-polysialyltransferase family protein [Clostridium sp.]
MSDEKIITKIFLMLGYFFQYITNTREKHDRKLVEKICGHTDYKKVVVQSKVGIFQTACVNAMCDRIIVCFEDGIGDYAEVPRFFKIHEASDIIHFLLAKMNVVNIMAYGQQFRLKYDDRTIKYCSLPERMRYRNFKAIKQMYEGYKSEERLTEEEKKYFKKNYEIIFFSTSFSDFGIGDEIYDKAHDWIKENCSGKSILIKKHPRETYGFEWNDVLFDICGEDISGEKVIDLLPDAKVCFFTTTTILLKMRREKKAFKVLKFPIHNKKYLAALNAYADTIGIGEQEWIEL